MAGPLSADLRWLLHAPNASAETIETAARRWGFMTLPTHEASRRVVLFRRRLSPTAYRRLTRGHCVGSSRPPRELPPKRSQTLTPPEPPVGLPLRGPCGVCGVGTTSICLPGIVRENSRG